MSILKKFDSAHIASMLRTSNYWAKFNRNQYPVKVEKALSVLYDRIECPCDSKCECKQHGCTHHSVRKPNLSFSTTYDHFLNCYVDEKLHDAICDGRKSGRGSKSVPVTKIIEDHWQEIQNVPSSNKNLICTNWACEPLHRLLGEFSPCGETMYMAKWMSLLAMGTYVAYDRGSVRLLKKDYDKPKTYRELMASIRKSLIDHLVQNNTKIDQFCLFDNPKEFFSIGSSTPRPIGNIIDKLYLVL